MKRNCSSFRTGFSICNRVFAIDVSQRTLFVKEDALFSYFLFFLITRESICFRLLFRCVYVLRNLGWRTKFLSYELTRHVIVVLFFPIRWACKKVRVGKCFDTKSWRVAVGQQMALFFIWKTEPSAGLMLYFNLMPSSFYQLSHYNLYFGIPKA